MMSPQGQGYGSPKPPSFCPLSFRVSTASCPPGNGDRAMGEKAHTATPTSAMTTATAAPRALLGRPSGSASLAAPGRAPALHPAPTRPETGLPPTTPRSKAGPGRAPPRVPGRRAPFAIAASLRDALTDRFRPRAARRRDALPPARRHTTAAAQRRPRLFPAPPARRGAARRRSSPRPR